MPEAHHAKRPISQQYSLTAGQGRGTTYHWPRQPEAAAKISTPTGEVTGEVLRLLAIFSGTMSRQELQAALNLKHEDHFRMAYLGPAFAAGLIEMTIPAKPKSRFQRYRLTEKGRHYQQGKS